MRQPVFPLFLCERNEGPYLLYAFASASSRDPLVIVALIQAQACYRPEFAVPDSVVTPQPKDFIRNEALPKTYDP